MFLYLQNETIDSIKFGVVLKLVMASKISEKEIWHNVHTMVWWQIYVKRCKLKNGSWKWIQIWKG